MSATTADSAAFSHDGEPVVFALEVVGGVFETIRLVVDREDADRPGLCAPGEIVGEVVRISADKRFVNGGLSVPSPSGTRRDGRTGGRRSAWLCVLFHGESDSYGRRPRSQPQGRLESATPSPGVRR
jgi:hypothetical protein